MKRIREGSAIIDAPDVKKISREMDVFYNPAMRLNRDVSVLLLNAVDNRHMQIADIMAGTGIRSIRFLKELRKDKIKRLCVNDRDSLLYIKKNFKLNKAKAEFHKEDANEFLLKSSGFDYIDIDPFGTPNDFLDSSIKRLSRYGILAVTATDTAALAGTFPDAGMRKYWSATYKNGFMHESSLRILARKVQLIGAQYDKALIPLLSYAREHYIRIFFRCVKGKKECDGILKQHKFILYNPKTIAYEVSEKNSKEGYVAIGPLFAGSLCDKFLLKRMISDVPDEWHEAKKVLTLLSKELDIVGSYDIHALCKRLKTTVPKFADIVFKSNGSLVHYDDRSIKTKVSVEELKRIISASH